MRAHNFGTVLAFEVRRTLSKPQFWLASLTIPVLSGLFFALIWASNSVAAASQEATLAQPLTFTYTDASGVVRPEVAERSGGRPSLDAAGDAEAVRQGRADLFVAYPADPLTQPVTVVARDVGLMENSRYTHVAGVVLRASALEAIGDSRLASLATKPLPLAMSTWQDGVRTPGWAGVLAPGIFLLLLYLTVLMLGNQMLNITVEEKENRVTEMILTTIHPTTLIFGKVVGVTVVGVIQTVVVGVPFTALLALFPGATTLGLGGADLDVAPLAGTDFVLSPWPIALGALLFLGGLVMFAGLLVAIGSVMPTAKDASGAFGIVIIAMFLPLYAAPLVMSQPTGLVSRVITFFPLTAPVTALLRNATGSLGVVEGVLSLGVILASAALFLALGVRLFRQGSISYGVRLPLAGALAAARGMATRKRSQPLG